MRLEQGHDTSAHLSPHIPRLRGWLALGRVLARPSSLRRCLRLRGSWAVLGRFLGCRAGHVEEAVVAVLHLLHHVEQERFTFTRGVFVGVGVVEFVTQHLDLSEQDVHEGV